MIVDEIQSLDDSKEGGLNNFKDLRIWQDSCDVVVDVYRLIDEFPKEEDTAYHPS